MDVSAASSDWTSVSPSLKDLASLSNWALAALGSAGLRGAGPPAHPRHEPGPVRRRLFAAGIRGGRTPGILAGRDILAERPGMGAAGDRPGEGNLAHRSPGAGLAVAPVDSRVGHMSAGAAAMDYGNSRRPGRP